MKFRNVADGFESSEIVKGLVGMVSLVVLAVLFFRFFILYRSFDFERKSTDSDYLFSSLKID